MTGGTVATETVNLDALAAAVEGIVGADYLHREERAEGFAIGRQTPKLVAAPGTPDEVAALLKRADESGAAVVPWGGGTHQTLGYPPRRYDLAVSLRRLNKVLAYTPEDLTIAVQAGMTLTDLRDALNVNGQMLPLDPAYADRATLGGILATHASGPRRHGYGTIRDFCIGLDAAYVDGTVAKAGGMVVKNVTGFDLMKMHLGAVGTLGVVTRLNFKLLPQPAAERTLVVQCARAEAALTLAARIVASPLMPMALEYVSPVAAMSVRAPLDGHLLCVRCEGSAATVARQERDVRDWCAGSGADFAEIATIAGDEHKRLWTSLADWSGTGDLTPSVAVLKLATLPTELPIALADIERIGAEHGLEIATRATVGIGVAHLRVTGDAAGAGLHAALGILQPRWPALTIWGCDPAHAATLSVWGTEPPTTGVMRELKQSFDPHSTLNPGRFLGGI